MIAMTKWKYYIARTKSTTNKDTNSVLKRVHKMIILMLLSSVVGYGQQLEVKRIELSGADVIFHYTLSDSVAGRSFTINLYTSRDNYINPLERLSGDFGLQVKAGNDRKVIWHAQQELGNSFDGKVAVEIRARVYVPFIMFDGFNKIKKGKPTDLTWRGGSRQHMLNFELYNKKGERVTVLNANTNAAANHTTVTLPGDVKAGKGYKFRIVDSKNKDLAVESTPFTIKRKVPFLLIALPIVAGGVVASQFINPPGEDGNIPDPPNTPPG